jgi:hypothetical protein
LIFKYILKENDKDPFGEFLVELGDQLIKKEWKNMMRQYKIPKEIEIEDAFDFFDWLRQRNIIRSSNLNELKKLFTKAGKEMIINEFIIPFESSKL